MSRWREMLMDYGQVFGRSSKSRSATSSEFFSVDGDLDEIEKANKDLRRTCEIYFRPLFQRYVYGGEKVACHDMRRILRDPEYRDKLPADKVSELADITEFNKGRAISYTEFVRIVMGQNNVDDTISFDSDLSDDLKKPKPESPKILPFVCRNTVAQELVEDHLDTYRCLPPAFFMILITVVEIVVYAYYCSEDVDARLKPLSGVPPINDLWYTPVRRREAWRFVTYFLLHDGYVDLIFNIILQIALGVPLEIMFSFWRIMIIYICGIITGSLAQSVTDHYVGLVGAAGGAYAVTFAHIMAIAQNWKSLNNNEKESKKMRILCSVTLRLFVIIVLVAAQVGLAVYRRFFSDNVVLIGLGAHGGGIATGWLLGRAFLQDPKIYPWNDGAGYLSLFLYLIFVGFCVIFNIAYVYYPVEVYP